MTKSLISARRWWSVTRPFASLIGAAVLILLPGADARATGYYGPTEFLSGGGHNLNASPEFYWELEVKRLAGGFHPPEKLFQEIRMGRRTDGSQLTDGALDDQTTDVDAQDFVAALAEGSIKPADPAKATEQHETARAALAKTTETSIGVPPEEFDSEFADYHRGALAYRRGKSHWDEARIAWGKIAEPAGGRAQISQRLGCLYVGENWR